MCGAHTGGQRLIRDSGGPVCHRAGLRRLLVLPRVQLVVHLRDHIVGGRRFSALLLELIFDVVQGDEVAERQPLVPSSRTGGVTQTAREKLGVRGTRHNPPNPRSFFVHSPVVILLTSL